MTNTFIPDYNVHLGEILKDCIKVRGIKKKELADQCGIEIKTIRRILNCKELITSKIAVQLEHVLRVSAVLWNNLSKNYQKRENLKRKDNVKGLNVDEAD